MFARSVLSLSAICLLSSCDKDGSQCRSEFVRAQEVVNGVKSDSKESLQSALAALDQAIAACDRAKLGSERDQLQKARNQIGAQVEVLSRRAARKKKEKPTAEQLAELAKKGDPTCPKGQAYRSRELKQEIKCTGPQLIDMAMADVEQYFSERKYKVTKGDGPVLKAEYGAERYVFTFNGADAKAGARCLEIYPPPGTSWQELTARMTGTGPEKLKPGKPIAAATRSLELEVEDSEKKSVARIGRCRIE